MGVVLRNLQKVVPLRRARLRRDVDTLRHILGVQKFDLGIICVDNRRIQQINKTYRKVNTPTDVLSFPFHEELRPGKLPCPLHRDELNLGDIFLGVEYLMKQCQDNSMDLHSTLTVVTAHGICHLLGYRHETEEEWDEMFQRESYILGEYNRLTGQNLEPLTKKCSQDS
ncbi:endoribonuclease YbeY [Gadus morhua]|uniref:YbeY metalloendoribonuclease n=1 Tax=Gadus morhua TaxID=8049 RepID=A0A8C5FBN8_GADMO|nr:endoribonuclease YbeY [Gadus morhua]XP_030198885.1 endoribonuclease YbeY [Gadus morhua]XP_030198886.1 endoribonuclease YbeY [Gadus morhua]XP_056435693.1 endoribonuclease YbeY [Gadus chalcogrammus]XP_056435694.1 endoribonuclease YbeY [Gadus chalcogrammus]XP_056435695.1 endoribonuclease YbeY [Gadus chalcogrammus]XP_059895138.1 endoribonuclease YbeY-like [Gadus macrocephalus]XP_059895139.1 endoribonuclease YbeY-like [Gadus macrocephalus]XP_059895140.1 endoribonuclease YbeY-like [Gadus macro